MLRLLNVLTNPIPACLHQQLVFQKPATAKEAASRADNFTHCPLRQASSAVDDPYSATLSLRPGTLRSALVTQHRPSALLSLQLCMDVRWPLSIVIGQVRINRHCTPICCCLPVLHIGRHSGTHKRPCCAKCIESAMHPFIEQTRLTRVGDWCYGVAERHGSIQ